MPSSSPRAGSIGPRAARALLRVWRAVLHARGEIEQGQLLRHESLIGSTFDARVEHVTSVGAYPAVVPSVAGRCWITSFNQLVLDPTDPFPHGYTPSDTWMSGN